MEKEEAWKRFEQTGSVADYLRYRGVTSSVEGEQPSYADQNRRPDHSGEQSHR